MHSSRRVDPWPAAAFAALLDTAPPPLGPGDPLPPLWHWFTLLEHPAQAELGADGHPADGHFLPPIPHRRRMFAGGRYRSHRPILIGAELACRSTLAEVSVKHGRSGELAFVTVRHELSVDGGPVGVEEQDIVYRSQPEGPRGRRPAARHRLRPGTGARRLAAHTAHRPRAPVPVQRPDLQRPPHPLRPPYATGVEGYPGLVVHGPLLALLALELPRRQHPPKPSPSSPTAWSGRRSPAPSSKPPPAARRGPGPGRRRRAGRPVPHRHRDAGVVMTTRP